MTTALQPVPEREPLSQTHQSVPQAAPYISITECNRDGTSPGSQEIDGWLVEDTQGAQTESLNALVAQQSEQLARYHHPPIVRAVVEVIHGRPADVCVPASFFF